MATHREPPERTRTAEDVALHHRCPRAGERVAKSSTGPPARGKLRRTLSDADIADQSEAQAVRDAVLRLHADQRELVILLHWDGFTIVEAAELLGLNASTARSRYAAARHQLRDALTERAEAASA